LDLILTQAPRFSAERLLNSPPGSPDIVESPDSPDATILETEFGDPNPGQNTPSGDMTTLPIDEDIDDTGDLP